MDNKIDSKTYRILQDQLRSILENLLPFEQEVIRMRFGLDDGYSYTIDDICRNLTTTRDIVQNIEAKVVKIFETYPNDSKTKIQKKHISEDIKKKVIAKVRLMRMREKVPYILDSLKPCEQKVVKMYYAVDGGDFPPMESVCHLCGITEEEFLHIKVKVLRRVSHLP